jgi:hypothetical protein
LCLLPNLQFFSLYYYFFLISFFQHWNLNQGLAVTKQALYHLSPSPQPLLQVPLQSQAVPLSLRGS